MRRIRQYPRLDAALDVLHFALYFGVCFPLAILWQIIARDMPRAVTRRRGSHFGKGVPRSRQLDSQRSSS
jgi:hypothetical protein